MKITRNIEAKTFPLGTLGIGEVCRMGATGSFYMVVDRNVFQLYLSGTLLQSTRPLIVSLETGILYQEDKDTLVFPVNARVEVSE